MKGICSVCGVKKELNGDKLVDHTTSVPGAKGRKTIKCAGSGRKPLV